MTNDKKIACPECGKEIDHLRYYQDVTEVSDVALHEDGTLEYTRVRLDSTDDPGTYHCPECDAEISQVSHYAADFLRGEL